MIVKPSSFKDVFAFELITARTAALVLPSEGGKMASFRDRVSGKEYLLQNVSPTFLHMGLADSFVDGECCGFDDMFPTIDPVTVVAPNGKTLNYPDHGEVCRVPFTYEANEDSLTLRYVSESLGYLYEKTYTEDEKGALRTEYRITNRSDCDLDVLWAAHCLIKVEKGGRVLLPFKEGEVADVMFDTSGVLPAGERITYTEDLLYTDWRDDAPRCRKFYFPSKAPEGYIAYRYPTGDTLMMRFERDVIPCIGIWENLGYLNGDYCIGLEPASVGYDTVKNAEGYGQKCLIKQGECMTFFLSLSVE